MALAGAGRGSGVDTTTATSFGFAPGSNLSNVALAVLFVAADNAASGGGAFATYSASDTKGNTWTRRQTPLYDPAGASAGIAGAIFTCPQDKGALLTTDTITISFGTDSPAIKAWALMEVTGITTPTYVTGNVNTGAGTATPTVTTGSITSGDMVLGGVFAENTASAASPWWTGDADVSNGSWSTILTAGSGSSTSGVSVGAQRKIVTGTATQTFNPTPNAGVPDCILAWIQVTDGAPLRGQACL